jgi:hypothetical protein
VLAVGNLRCVFRDSKLSRLASLRDAKFCFVLIRGYRRVAPQPPANLCHPSGMKRRHAARPKWFVLFSSAGSSRQPPVRQLNPGALGAGLPTSPMVRSPSSSAGSSRQPPVRQLKPGALGAGLPTSPTVRLPVMAWEFPSLPVGAHRGQVSG